MAKGNKKICLCQSTFALWLNVRGTSRKSGVPALPSGARIGLNNLEDLNLAGSVRFVKQILRNNLAVHCPKKSS